MNNPPNTMADERAFVALGANLPSRFGPPLKTLAHALGCLEALSDGAVAASSPFLSVAEGCEAGAPDFVNAVAAFIPASGTDAEALLEQLQAIEIDCGRDRSRAGVKSRSLDLDLVCWGSRQQHSERLVLPHPRAAARLFVLAPLAELSPRLVLPGMSVSVRQLCSELEGQGEQVSALAWS